MAQVPARCEVEAQDPVSGAQEHEEHRLVRLRARVRLDVGVDRAEEFPCALDGEALDDVDVLAAAVKTVSRITLQRLVAHLVSERLAHRRVGIGEGTRGMGVGVVAGVHGATHPIPSSRRGRNSARSGT